MTQHTAAAQRTKYVLDEADLPTQWYNIQADCTEPDAWNGHSIPLPASTTNTRASARPAAISPTPLWPRRITTSWKE